MNLIPLIVPIIAGVATIVISSIRDPGGWRFEKQTKRLQYWKAMLEVLKLAEAESAVNIDLKRLCHQDLVEIANDDAERRSSFAKEVATILTSYLSLAIVFLMLQLNQGFQSQRFGLPPMSVDQLITFKATVDYSLAVLELGCFLILWIWIRPRIRRYIWTQFVKPGNGFGSFFGKERVHLAVSFVLIIVVPLLLVRFLGTLK